MRDLSTQCEYQLPLSPDPVMATSLLSFTEDSTMNDVQYCTLLIELFSNIFLGQPFRGSCVSNVASKLIG